MIKLTDGWEIDFDGDYIVRKKSGKTDKNGLPIYSVKKFPNSLSQACQIVLRANFGKYIADNDVTLAEALKEMQRMNDELKKMLEVFEC